jgi:hypothetical protein
VVLAELKVTVFIFCLLTHVANGLLECWWWFAASACSLLQNPACADD